MLNKTAIEFCDYTLNPMTGCQNGCSYCWAARLWNRYNKKLGPFDHPRFYPERLKAKTIVMPKVRNEIVSIISPDKPVVFMVDMGDIFTPGGRDEWIDCIFKYCEQHQEATFLFLTKIPTFYPLYSCRIPHNTILGTSLDKAHFMHRLDPLKILHSQGYRTFVNIEPILSFMWALNFDDIDFVTVGAIDRGPAPLMAWVKSIQHPRIYYKKNLIRHFPTLTNVK